MFLGLFYLKVVYVFVSTVTSEKFNRRAACKAVLFQSG